MCVFSKTLCVVGTVFRSQTTLSKPHPDYAAK